ncbi:MAG: DUF3365 domain-containing protein [Verrucomicrobiales bacterium]|nr:DUF3365 domain-containing protein [Verrucomicrobiales bacterium]
MIRNPLPTLVATLLLLAGCGPQPAEPVSNPGAADHSTPPPPAPPDLDALKSAALLRGKSIVQEAFTVLSSQLGAALQSGGVSNALSLCSVKALPLTQLVGNTNQVTLRRVTHKPRNPANRANTDEQHLLDCFQEMLSAGTTNLTPMVLTPSTNRISFCAPIVINNPLCLNCHGVPGETLLPAAATLLKQLYPTDEATGFKLGDLRGMWRVDFDPAVLQ